MAINLQKGHRIKIDLEKVGVELGWSPNESTGYAYDLDASAFMLGENNRLPADEFFVFYNNQTSPDGAVKSSGDDLDGDDGETLEVDLSKVDRRVTEILFMVTIYEAEKRRQNFGQVHDSYIRIYNTITGEEIARYDLDEEFFVETAVEFGRLYRYNGQWKFEAIGKGYKEELNYFVDKYNR